MVWTRLWLESFGYCDAQATPGTYDITCYKPHALSGNVTLTFNGVTRTAPAVSGSLQRASRVCLYRAPKAALQMEISAEERVSDLRACL
jgi:hypothetical protein